MEGDCLSACFYNEMWMLCSSMIFNNYCCPWRSCLSPFPQLPLPCACLCQHPEADAEGREKMQANTGATPQIPSHLRLFAAQPFPPFCPWERSCRISDAHCNLYPSLSTQSPMSSDIYKLKAITGQFWHVSDPEGDKCNFNELEFGSTHGITPGMFIQSTDVCDTSERELQSGQKMRGALCKTVFVTPRFWAAAAVSVRRSEAHWGPESAQKLVTCRYDLMFTAVGFAREVAEGVLVSSCTKYVLPREEWKTSISLFKPRDYVLSICI